MKHKTSFDEENCLDKLTKQGDPLIKLKRKVDWEIFRNTLEEAFKKKNCSQGGRRAYDYVLMFKILILQRYYNLSDEQMEFQINDRLSFNRFLDLGLQDSIPDRTTIWNFREYLTKKGIIKALFNRFKEELENKRLLVREGTKVMVDATFVDVPKQRNSRKENKIIKEGSIPAEWEKNKKKLCQKETDAIWVTKNKERHYGYKKHIKAEGKGKLIENYDVSSASVDDSQKMDSFIGEGDKDREVYGDSAYSGEPIADLLKKNKAINKIQEKGYRNHQLTEEQKKSNREKSKVRARVEHVFGFIENSMKRCFIRSIGIERANTNICLMNLTYNIFRSIQLQKA